MSVKFLPRYEVRLVRNGHCKYEATKLDSSERAQKICIQAARSILEDSPTEKFLIVTLDTQLRLIGIHEITSGTLDSSLVHPREVFRHAYLCNASSIILMHNHPSGDVLPSSNDLQVTKRLKEAGDLLGITVTDHIVVGHDPNSGNWNAYSIRENHPW
jgi:DNA repair protein RadC